MMPIRRPLTLLSLLMVAYASVLAEATLTLVRRDARTVSIVLDNSEPVAALQMTIVSTGPVSIVSASGTLSAEWTVASNVLTTHELRLVVLGKTRIEILPGSTEIARLQIAAGEMSLHEAGLELCQLVASTGDGRDIEATGATLSLNSAAASAAGFGILGNHPNPFNPSTVITFRLDHSEDVRLAVYDMLGREVTLLVHQLTSAGTHQVTWNIDRATTATGTYFARLSVGDRSQVARMIVSK